MPYGWLPVLVYSGNSLLFNLSTIAWVETSACGVVTRYAEEVSLPREMSISRLSCASDRAYGVSNRMACTALLVGGCCCCCRGLAIVYRDLWVGFSGGFSTSF